MKIKNYRRAIQLRCAVQTKFGAHTWANHAQLFWLASGRENPHQCHAICHNMTPIALWMTARACQERNQPRCYQINPDASKCCHIVLWAFPLAISKRGKQLSLEFTDVSLSYSMRNMCLEVVSIETRSKDLLEAMFLQSKAISIWCMARAFTSIQKMIANAANVESHQALSRRRSSPTLYPRFALHIENRV